MLTKGFGIMLNEILFHKELTDKQKLLYCFITSLCAEKGHCWASNKYIGEQLSVTEGVISKNVSTLKEMGMIEVEIKEKNSRIIKLANLVKNHQGVSEKSLGGDGEKSPHNNINNNNINKYIFSDENKKPSSEDFKKDIEEIYKYYVNNITIPAKYHYPAKTKLDLASLVKEMGKETLMKATQNYFSQTEMKWRKSPRYFFSNSTKSESYRMFEGFIQTSSSLTQQEKKQSLSAFSFDLLNK